MWCLSLSLLAKNSALIEILLVHPKCLNPNLFQVSTIPTYGLSKIPQVSCHRCKKAIKIASKTVRSFRVRENWVLYELGWQRIKATHCIINCHLKGQYNVTFSCTKGLSIQTNELMATSASLCEGPIFYFMYLLLCKDSKFSLYSFLFSLLASIMWWGKI